MQVAEKVRWPGQTGEAIVLSLNFLWLLSFFQEKESNKHKTNLTISNTFTP